MPDLHRSDVEDLLRDLGERLAARDVEGRIYVVGGAAIALEWDSRRSTHDIDAVLDPAVTVKAVARDMAHERHLDPDWLSDAAAAFVPASDADLPGRTLAVIGRIAIVVAPAEHLLAMKMAAFRRSDMSDLRVLVAHLGLTSPEQIADICERAYGQDSVLLSDRADLLWQAGVILDT